ncbi:MAG TPA: hypothetical protein VFJ66_04070, partial [Gaiellales bacterium]|nr:hypothetical protein [Gaiellales bacterium]
MEHEESEREQAERMVRDRLDEIHQEKSDDLDREEAEDAALGSGASTSRSPARAPPIPRTPRAATRSIPSRARRRPSATA